MKENISGEAGKCCTHCAERNLPQCHSLGTLSSRQSGTSTSAQTGVLQTRSDDRECTAAEGDQALQLRVVPTALGSRTKRFSRGTRRASFAIGGEGPGYPGLVWLQSSRPLT